MAGRLEFGPAVGATTTTRHETPLGFAPGTQFSQERANWVKLVVAALQGDPELAERRARADWANQVYGQAAEAREAGNISAAERLSQLGDLIRRA
jgi:hypothetical protein